MWKTTIPKDKSGTVYYSDTDKELLSSKKLLVKTIDESSNIDFHIGYYVHSRKEWICVESFRIDNVFSWCDPNYIK